MVFSHGSAVAYYILSNWIKAASADWWGCYRSNWCCQNDVTVFLNLKAKNWLCFTTTALHFLCRCLRNELLKNKPHHILHVLRLEKILPRKIKRRDTERCMVPTWWTWCQTNQNKYTCRGDHRDWGSRSRSFLVIELNIKFLRSSADQLTCNRFHGPL